MRVLGNLQDVYSVDSGCKEEDSLYSGELSWFYSCKKKKNYYKVVQKVLQSGTVFLLQNWTTAFTKWNRFFHCKVRQFY